MAPWKPAAAVTAALLMLVALVATSTPSHGHGPDTQPAGHTDCTACDFRQLSVVQVDTVPAPSAPDLVAHDVPSAHPQGELGSEVAVDTGGGENVRWSFTEELAATALTPPRSWEQVSDTGMALPPEARRDLATAAELERLWP